jgi:hypothetical protein
LNEDYPEDFEQEDPRDKMVKLLCKAVRFYESNRIGFKDLLKLVDEIEGEYESDDPRSMGWVGDDGLP